MYLYISTFTDKNCKKLYDETMVFFNIYNFVTEKLITKNFQIVVQKILQDLSSPQN